MLLDKRRADQVDTLRLAQVSKKSIFLWLHFNGNAVSKHFNGEL